MPAPGSELADRWAARHPGFEAGHGLLSGWLRLMWRLARPLAVAGISPDVVTLAGAGLAVTAARARPGVASALLLGSALCDGLDGAVAVLRDTSSAHGTALDHTADRVGDVAAAAVLVRAGSSPWLSGPALTLSLGQELLRGRRAPGLTVNERPMRIVCAMLGDLTAGATGRRWPATVAAVVWDGLAVVGAVQVWRRRPADRSP